MKFSASGAACSIQARESHRQLFFTLHTDIGLRKCFQNNYQARTHVQIFTYPHKLMDISRHTTYNVQHTTYNIQSNRIYQHQHQQLILSRVRVRVEADDAWLGIPFPMQPCGGCIFLFLHTREQGVGNREEVES